MRNRSWKYKTCFDKVSGKKRVEFGGSSKKSCKDEMIAVNANLIRTKTGCVY